MMIGSLSLRAVRMPYGQNLQLRKKKGAGLLRSTGRRTSPMLKVLSLSSGRHTILVAENKMVVTANAVRQSVG